MVGVCLDVTERKHAEEKFRLAVEAAPAAMIMVDPGGTIVLVNALTEELLGFARHEIVGQPVDRLVPPRFHDRHPEYRKTFFADPRQRPMGAGRELYALRKDGSEVPVEIGLSPLDTADGRFVLAAVTDITDRKRSAAALEDAVRARDDFLAMASHELRNPINALQLQLVGVLREAERQSESLPREWVSRRVGQARDQVARLERLVGNLLDVTRISAGRLDLELEDLDFGSIVQETVDRFRNELKNLDVTLRLTPAIGRSDKLRLDQIVSNLLRNAVNYGEGKPIEVSLEANGNTVRLSVTDHGIGIDPENQKRIFEPFERAVSKRRYGGFGLGLWITRQIVDAMRGHISVDSWPGQGSTFSVVVPRTLSPTPSNKAAETSIT
jgi:PAS domain S-box-containing protein